MKEDIHASEARYGDYPHNLVKRPAKGFLWGLGTETHKKEGEFFRKGELPTISEIMHFLEVYQARDIKAVDL